jgi:hypothetical protein
MQKFVLNSHFKLSYKDNYNMETGGEKNTKMGVFERKFSVVKTLASMKIGEEVIISNRYAKRNNIQKTAKTSSWLVDMEFKITERGLVSETKVIRTA